MSLSLAPRKQEVTTATEFKMKKLVDISMCSLLFRRGSSRLQPNRTANAIFLLPVVYICDGEAPLLSIAPAVGETVDSSARESKSSRNASTAIVVFLNVSLQRVNKRSTKNRGRETARTLTRRDGGHTHATPPPVHAKSAAGKHPRSGPAGIAAPTNILHRIRRRLPLACPV